MITMGDGGSVAVTADAAVEQEAFEIAAVDTTGAGDAFCGALAVRLGTAMRRRAILLCA